MYRILIVDDEFEIRSLIRIHMERAGLQVFEAESGRQAIQKLQEQAIDLMVLDLMMDDGNGFEVLRHLSDTHSKTLVVALSARRELHDKVETLGMGADDYVTKPFSPIELLARVQAQLRRHPSRSQKHSEMIRMNKLVLDVDNLVLHNNDKKHHLTQVECDLLNLFMNNPDRILTKMDIYQHVWKHNHFDANNLSVFINRLRAILDDTTDSSSYIHTVRGVGYRFSGDGR